MINPHPREPPRRENGALTGGNVVPFGGAGFGSPPVGGLGRGPFPASRRGLSYRKLLEVTCMHLCSCLLRPRSDQRLRVNYVVARDVDLGN